MSTRAAQRTPDETYGPALFKAEQAFRALEPREAALRAGAEYEPAGAEGGRIVVPFFGTLYQLAWPDGTVAKATGAVETDVAVRLLLLHHLACADGTPMAGQWIAFRDLSGGLGYDAAFQRRASLRLAQVFGSGKAAFEKAARAMGGERLEFGDASFAFRLLPCIWLAVVLYVADEEFGANASVLFDGAANHYLPTEDLVVLGGMLASRLCRSGCG